MSISDEAFGTEIQFLTESAYQFKKSEDKIYKPRDAISALMR
jgi:hypothetical protein